MSATEEATKKSKSERTKTGVVVSNKMQKTVVVAVENLVKHGMYQKYVKQTSKFLAHNENNDINVGDRVVIEVETSGGLRRRRHDARLARPALLRLRRIVAIIAARRPGLRDIARRARRPAEYRAELRRGRLNGHERGCNGDQQQSVSDHQKSARRFGRQFTPQPRSGWLTR